MILGHNLWGHKSSFVRICEIYDSQEGQCHPKGLSWNFVLKWNEDVLRIFLLSEVGVGGVFMAFGWWAPEMLNVWDGVVPFSDIGHAFFFFNYFIFVCVGSSLLRAGFSPAVASGGYSSLWCMGFSLQWLLLLQSTGSRHAGFSSCGHGLSCSAACGIFPDQGSNPCPLHWQADS